MSNYYIKAVILDSCPYSIAAKKLIENNNINNEMIIIDSSNKENYKTELISTFPQIYLERKHRKGSLLLGGYSDLKSFFDKFKSQKLNDNNVKEFCNKYNWSKKATLRFIELINLV